MNSTHSTIALHNQNLNFFTSNFTQSLS